MAEFNSVLPSVNPLDMGSLQGGVKELVGQEATIRAEDRDLSQQEIEERRSALTDQKASHERIRGMQSPDMSIPKFDGAATYAWSNHAKAVGGILAIIGVIGAAKMKTGAVGAMKALTAVMTGMQTGHEAMYNRALTEYQTNLTAILAEQKNMLAAHHKAIQNEQMTAQEQVDAHNLRLLEFGVARKDKVHSLTEVHQEITTLFKAQTELMKQKEAARRLRPPHLSAPEQREKAIQSLLDANEDMTYAEAYEKTAPSGKGKKAGRAFTPAGGTKTPQQWVDEVKADPKFKDKSPEEIAAEAKKRAGVK
jgi:DNA repair exonuclease SbcCD ATPase subunit